MEPGEDSFAAAISCSISRMNSFCKLKGLTKSCSKCSGFSFFWFAGFASHLNRFNSRLLFSYLPSKANGLKKAGIFIQVAC
jgi:hypothetical protein